MKTQRYREVMQSNQISTVYVAKGYLNPDIPEFFSVTSHSAFNVSTIEDMAGIFSYKPP